MQNFLVQALIKDEKQTSPIRLGHKTAIGMGDEIAWRVRLLDPENEVVLEAVAHFQLLMGKIGQLADIIRVHETVKAGVHGLQQVLARHPVHLAEGI